MTLWTNFGNIVTRGDEGETVFLGFPHEEPAERANYVGVAGRQLGPNCLWRFLPNIASVPQSVGLISTIGDVLRPRQGLRHKYIRIKGAFSFEELLEDCARIAAERVLLRGRRLILNSSTLETAISLYQSQRRSDPSPLLYLVFSPFLHLQPHYSGENVRYESVCRRLLELFQKGDKLLLFGAHRNRANSLELDFLIKRENQMKVFFEEELTIEEIITKTENLCNGETPIVIAFSFASVDSQYFPGCGEPNHSSLFGPKLLLSLFRSFGSGKAVRALQFSEFNPQCEDYHSGVAFATLLFELLNARHNLLPIC